MTEHSRPLIAVSGPDGWLVPAWWFTWLAIFLAGGRAVRVTPKYPREEIHSQLSSLIIGGGDDIDPGLYSLNEDEAGHAPINAARDAFEQHLIRFALARKMPLFGICRGAQLINVVLGGTLYSDICNLRKKTSNRRTPFPIKSAFIEAASCIFKALGRKEVRINSLHHQAIKAPGRHIKIVARDADDFAQAIELESTSETHSPAHFLVGVQWHPEYMPLHAEQRRLFTALVTAARGFEETLKV